jgi:competence ComEA-like helix-hairpin-helix protein
MTLRVLSLAALGAALAAPAAAAAATPTPAPLGFGIKARQAPKGYFVFKNRPGDRVRGSFEVSNLTRRRQVVYLREADAFTAQAGGVEFTKQGGVPIHAGSWFKIARHVIVLRPHEDVEVEFSGKVPQDARAGDHLAGVIAYGKRPPHVASKGNFGFRLLSRLAIAVQFTLPGERVTGIDVKDTDITVSPVGAALELDLGNSGNTLIEKTTGKLEVTKGSRRLFSPNVELGTFVPKTEIRYALAWPGTPVEGTYHVSGVLRPQGGAPVRIDKDLRFGQARIREFRAETGRQAIEAGGTPAWIWAALGAALMAVLGLLFLLLWSRRRDDDGDHAAARAPRFPPPVERAHLDSRPAPVAERLAVAVTPIPTLDDTLGADDELVDLNTADTETLMQLPGVGRRAAERIVAYRDEYGDFASVMDLKAVDGFDEHRIRRLIEHATV